MDPGTVVWLPGSGLNETFADAACRADFGGDYFACGEGGMDGGLVEVYCCH
jgi:hypothetical protein